jgi:hypothetical protein
MNILCQAQIPGHDSNFHIPINPDSNVAELRRKIAEHLSVGIDLFALICVRQKLVDGKTIRSYNIKPTQIIYVINTLQGGE